MNREATTEVIDSGATSLMTFWGLGERLMGSIGFKAKALIISVVFVLPPLLIGYFYASAQNELVQFTAKERKGVEAMQRLIPLSGHILATRNIARAELGGFDAGTKFADAKAGVGSDLAAFGKYLTDTEDPLVIRNDFDALSKEWEKAISSQATIDGNGRIVFGLVNEALMKLWGDLGDNSNLSLDPDMDSYYLFSALAAAPQIREDMGQLWGWGTYAKSRFKKNQKELEISDVLRYVVWAANVSSEVSTGKGYMDKVYANNASIKARVNTSAFDAAQEFYEAAKDPDALQKDMAVREPLKNSVPRSYSIV